MERLSHHRYLPALLVYSEGVKPEPRRRGISPFNCIAHTSRGLVFSQMRGLWQGRAEERWGRRTVVQSDMQTSEQNELEVRYKVDFAHKSKVCGVACISRVGGNKTLCEIFQGFGAPSNSACVLTVVPTRVDSIMALDDKLDVFVPFTMCDVNRVQYLHGASACETWCCRQP